MKKILLLFITALAFGFLFDYFFYGQSLGISFPLYFILLIAVFFGLTSYQKLEIPLSAWLLTVPLLFFAIMVAARASEFLTFLNIVAVLYLSLLLTQTIIAPHLHLYRIKNYFKTLFVLPMQYILGFFKSLPELLAFRLGMKNREQGPQIIRGLLITVPFLIIFILLFSSADLVFQKGIQNIFDFDISPTTLVRAGIIAVITAILLGMLWHVLGQLHKPEEYSLVPPLYQIKKIESSILFGSLNVLFFAFLAIQVRYLFGGTSNITADGFTYAEYAHRGFFELIAVACISLALILTIEHYMERRETSHFGSFKVLSGVLVLQVLVIMASAFKRLSLYEAAYGFTTLRLYSHIAIVFIGLVLLLLLYKIIINNREERFVFPVFISAVMFLFIINVSNPDAFIARKNIEKFGGTDKLDVKYLQSLSDDALDELRKVPEIPAERFERETPKDWQSYRL